MPLDLTDDKSTLIQVIFLSLTIPLVLKISFIDESVNQTITLNFINNRNHLKIFRTFYIKIVTACAHCEKGYVIKRT